MILSGPDVAIIIFCLKQILPRDDTRNDYKKKNADWTNSAIRGIATVMELNTNNNYFIEHALTR